MHGVRIPSPGNPGLETMYVFYECILEVYEVGKTDAAGNDEYADHDIEHLVAIIQPRVGETVGQGSEAAVAKCRQRVEGREGEFVLEIAAKVVGYGKVT